MALPRPALLGILGVLLIAAAFAATRGLVKKNDGSTSTPPAQTIPAPKQVAPPAKARHAAATPAKSTHAGAKHATKTHTAKANAVSPKAGASQGLPVSVAEALGQHRVVVLYFGGHGADDALTAASVRDLKASAGSDVAVFTDDLSNLADYRRVVEGLDVSQAPSIVIVGRDRKARLLEGFIDAGSLRQDVADVTR
jgi:hypothetical protein